MTLLHWARKLVLELGVSIVPIWPGGKTPCVPGWKAYQERLPTADELQEWFARGDRNLAIVCGAVSGLVAIDVDSPAAAIWAQENLPETKVKTRSSRGEHWWYRHPGVMVPNRVKLKTEDAKLDIDVRGDGGYCVGPQSVHESGFVYEAVGDWSKDGLAALPTFDPAWLPPPPASLPMPERPREFTPTDRSAWDRAVAYMAKAQPVGKGQRDAKCYYYACTLSNDFRGLTDDECIRLLLEWDNGNQPPLGEAYVAKKLASARRTAKLSPGRLADAPIEPSRTVSHRPPPPGDEDYISFRGSGGGKPTVAAEPPPSPPPPDDPVPPPGGEDEEKREEEEQPSSRLVAEPSPDEVSVARIAQVGEDVILELPRGYAKEKYSFDTKTKTKYIAGYSPLTNWTVNVKRLVRNADDQSLSYDGLLHWAGRSKPIVFDDEHLADERKLRAFLINRAGTGLVTSPRHVRLVAEAVSAFSDRAPEVTGCSATGYVDDERYVMPSVIIEGGVVRENTDCPCVLPGDIGPRYDMRIISDEEALEASIALLERAILVHSQGVTLPLLGAMLGAPLLSRCRWARFALYLEGGFGKGKTLPCKVLLNLFADIPIRGNDGKGSGLVSAGSTGNALEYDAYVLRDVPLIIDDVKLEIVSLPAILRLIQTGHDGTARGRLGSKMQRRKQYHARGQLIINGEEIPPNVASAISRCLVVPVRQGVNIDLVPELDEKRRIFRGLTPRYIAWTQTQPAEQLAEYTDMEFDERSPRTSMFSRQVLASLRNFFRFLCEAFPSYWLPRADDLTALMSIARASLYEIADITRERTVTEAKEETFLGCLASLVASGKATIGTSSGSGTVPAIAFPLLTTEKDLLLDIDIRTAVAEASKLCKVPFSIPSLGAMLQDGGHLVQSREHGPSLQRRIGGKRLCVWRVHASSILSEEQIEHYVRSFKGEDARDKMKRFW